MRFQEEQQEKREKKKTVPVPTTYGSEPHILNHIGLEPLPVGIDINVLQQPVHNPRKDDGTSNECPDLIVKGFEPRPELEQIVVLFGRGGLWVLVVG
jgi:hypothetical protein